MNELASMFHSAIIEAIMVLAADPSKDEHYDKRVRFCVDYYTKLYNATGNPKESEDERGGTIGWLVSKANPCYCGAIVILPKDVGHFKKLEKLVDVFKRIDIHSPVSQGEMDEADDIVHELKKIVIG